MRTNEYKLKSDPDGTVWVSIQPLQKDIVEHIKLLGDVDISNLDKFDQKEYDIKIMGLNAIYTFLGALIQEHTLNQLREKNEQE